jgi:hypothetical protein
LDAVNVRWEVVSMDEMERVDNETPQELKTISENNVNFNLMLIIIKISFLRKKLINNLLMIMIMDYICLIQKMKIINFVF